MPQNTTQLSGAASYDPDGKISKYKWKTITASGNYSLSNTDSASITLSNLGIGNYSLSLSVTDDKNATTSDTILVSVKDTLVLKANAGNKQFIPLPTNSATLDGSNSYVGENKTIIKYKWLKISGPSQYSLTNADSIVAKLSNLTEGKYLFQLSVSDGNKTSLDTAEINIIKDIAPVAKAGKDISIQLPQNSIQLDGSSSYDSDGKITRYFWRKLQGPTTVTFTHQDSAITTVSGLGAGTYIFRLAVRDNQNVRTFDSVVVTVQKKLTNEPPVAKAGSNAVITLPTNQITLDGSASFDSDGTIKSYTWKKITGPSTFRFTDETAATTQFTNLVAGIYQVKLTVKR